MRDSSSLRSCLLLLLVANAALVHASENDDLVFDQDGKQFIGEAPLIESRQQDSLFHRIKRGLWDIFSPSETTTTTTEAPESEDDNADNELNNAPPVQSDEDKEPQSSNLERITRDSAEEYDDDDENNEVGNAAEGRREPANFGNTDDEDLAGSGEVEGSATEFDTKVNYASRRERRFYRITLTVGEPYRREYADRSSREYKELSGNLTQPLEELLNRDIPNENHHVNVVKISPTSDSFTSQVTLDIGSTLADETEMQYIIEKQLQIHSLGNVQVRPDGFTFRIFQVGFEEVECDQSAELTCRDGTCVPLERRCDGIADCKDSSDEEGCSETTTQPSIRDFGRTDHNEILGVVPEEDDGDINRVDSISSKCRADDTIRCRDGSRSICSVQQCDGVKDCDDGDDEDGCPHPGCSPGEFACDVSRCILDSQRCNFVQDCDDGSDEHDCNYPACTASQFKCGNGQCIDSGGRCNNVEDCLDRSDELNCPCGENKFECTPGYCVDKSKRCDGYQDCGNGRDEENCQHITRCRSDEFECLDGSCVSQTSRCDGRSDCRDRSDEINCTVTTCSGDQFRCLDGTCISIDKRCNQNIDCRNGEDENQCGCGEAQFRCTDGRCIGYELQCNGVEECSDGSDERDCEKAKWRNLYNDEHTFRKYLETARMLNWNHVGDLKQQNLTNPKKHPKNDFTIDPSSNKLSDKNSSPQNIWRSVPKHSNSLPRIAIEINDPCSIKIVEKKTNPGNIWRSKSRNLNPSPRIGFKIIDTPNRNSSRSAKMMIRSLNDVRDLTDNEAKKPKRNRKKNHRKSDVENAMSSEVSVLTDSTNSTTVVNDEKVRTKKKKSRKGRKKGQKGRFRHMSIFAGTKYPTDSTTPGTVSSTVGDDPSSMKNEILSNKIQKEMEEESTSKSVEETTVSKLEDFSITPEINLSTREEDEVTLEGEVNRTTDSVFVSVKGESLILTESSEKLFVSEDESLEEAVVTTSASTEQINSTDFSESTNWNWYSEEDLDKKLNFTGEEDALRLDSGERNTSDISGTKYLLEEKLDWSSKTTFLEETTVPDAENSSWTTEKYRTSTVLSSEEILIADGSNQDSTETSDSRKDSEETTYYDENLEEKGSSSVSSTASTITDEDYSYNVSANVETLLFESNLNNSKILIDLLSKDRLTDKILPNSIDQTLEAKIYNCTSKCVNFYRQRVYELEEKLRQAGIEKSLTSENKIDSGLIEDTTLSKPEDDSNSSDSFQDFSEFSEVFNHSLTIKPIDSKYSDATESLTLVETVTELSKNNISKESKEIIDQEEGQDQHSKTYSRVDDVTVSTGLPATKSSSSPARRKCKKDEKTSTKLRADQDVEDDCEEDMTERPSTTNSDLIFKETSTTANCDPDQFVCSDGTCIAADKWCDGYSDCPDYGDEFDCNGNTNGDYENGVNETEENSACPMWKFACDGTCIDNIFVCNSVKDCEDGLDEADCGMEGVCTPAEWKCASGECIAEIERCDNVTHCADGSDEIGCVSECPVGMFRCNDGLCLDSKRRCDGRQHCKDGSDEINCQCPNGERPCDNGVCINKNFFCDNNIDCHDGSDERDCNNVVTPPAECRADEFTCRDGTCIPQSAVCDRRPDCPHEDDEANCHQGCGKDQFQCANGNCIRADQQCNNFIDCDDGSDENCDHNPPPVSDSCPHGYVACTRDKDCVPQSSLCNGVPECRDRSDEENCYGESRRLNLKTYPSEQLIKESREVVFQCRDEGLLRARVRWLRGNNLPLPPGSRDVNGRLEIPNIQLEHSGVYICEAVGYPSSMPGQQVSVYLTVEKFEPPPTNKPHACQYDEATCSNGECIPKSYVCNGRLDCTDGSDEMRCSPHGCEPNQFRCNNTECVSKVWRCDGDKDCADGSDEEDCAPNAPGTPCRFTEFACGSHDQCIPKSYHCDLERDCIDGSDEVGCSPVYIVKPPPPMIIVSQGTTLMITCTAIGIPTPEISWRLNWGHVPPKCYMTSINGTGTLSCPDMQPEDQGAYSCEALNSAGFVIAIPDAIVIVNKTGPEICPKGTFNSEARTADECISCFCFGVATQCHSANLFTYHIPPPFDRHSIVSVKTQPDLQILNDITRQVQSVRGIGRDGVQLYDANQLPLDSREEQEVAYFVMPENYHGNQLKSYGGYLKYRVTYNGTGIPNTAPSVILTGNNYRLLHKGKQIITGYDNEEAVRFFDGEWYKQQGWAEVPATREDIMMTLENVDNILIKVQYDDSPYLDVRLTNIVMDTADVRNTGLGSASYVEECECPIGYSGLSCEQCAPGYERRESGPWLGQCYLAAPPGCPLGYYGDPARNIPCQMCPCPLTNPSNQFARTCHLGSDGQPTCDCPAGYIGRRCEQCNVGYRGNPLIPGDMCVPESSCDPDGSLSTIADPNTGRCRCKQYVTGLTCNQCKANTFNLASKNQFGCISCFCMGITDKCVSSNWYRNDIRVSFTNSVRDFSLIESRTPDSLPITDGIRLDTVSREIIYNEFPNRGNNDVYYWQLPSIFLGDQVTSYGGNLKYTVRYVPSPGGQSSKNNAADVELISANDINLLYFSKESPEPNTPQTFVVPLLEQYWQRNDGTQADREHLLMALADIRAIRIKATYTTHTDEAALSLVSLDTAEKYNTGRARAVEVEECSCPVGYKGLSCEDCDVGYTRGGEGLYLGTCEPCYCNGHSNQCNPDTGVCENCAHHTTGDLCEFCESGYTGDATRGTPYDCTGREVNHTDCNEMGSRSSLYIGDRCDCKRNVEGRQCNRCRPATFGLSAENPDGCSECYCSGLTDQCHESSLYVQQIPMWVYDNQHGFTLTDSTRQEIIDHRDFELNLATNEIGYRYPDSRRRSLLWSLPPIFTGNKVKSYGGSLTLTQHITAIPGAQSYKDQDIILIGNGITLFWTNPIDIQPDVPLTYSVPFRESEWKRLTTEGPRVSSRTDLMTVLSNLEAILVRATHSEGMSATYISDISLDTAVEHPTGNRRAVQVEVCRCPTGYVGTSCESCSTGYYRDTSDRSVSYLGSCILCPCNNNEESCEMTHTGHVKCHCKPGFVGQYCQYTEGTISTTTTSRPPVNPPKIVVYIREPEFQIVEAGGTVRYHCFERTDNGSLHIRWEKEGDELPIGRSIDDKRGLLIIRDLKVSDSGIYICQISDGVHIGYKNVTLTVGVPPRVIVEPSSLQVIEGEPAEFRCEATGNPPPRVEWIRVYGPMSPGVVVNNGILLLRSASRYDAAEYKCMARNNVGVDERTVILHVEEKSTQPIIPPTITPSQWFGQPGETIVITCVTSLVTNLTWSRERNPLPHTASQRDGVLTIVNPTPYDSGIYVCTSTSYIGMTNSTINITVTSRTPAPFVKVTPEKQTVPQGSIAEIRCLTSRESGEHMTWSKYLQPLSSNVRQVGDTLRIVDIQIADRGIYVCRVTGPSGTHEASAMIEVERREPPLVEIYPKNVPPVTLDGSTDLQCRATGIPMPELHWSHESGRPFPHNIKQLPGGVLRLTNITASDGGSYVCTAINPAGTNSAMVYIEVQSMPVISISPQSGMLHVRPGDRVRLLCSANGFPEPSVTWSRHPNVVSLTTNEVAAPHQAVYEIHSASSSDEGSYICHASSRVGTTEERVYIRVEDINDGNDNAIRTDYLRIPDGGKVEMRCHVQDSDGHRIYLDWRRADDRPLPAGNSVDNGVLIIPVVDKSAAGEYVCTGRDLTGNVLFRATSVLEVLSPPRIVLIPPRQTVRSGENPSIECRTTGDEPMNIEWDAIGRSLPHSVTHHRGLLQFHGITYSDAGKYVCKATNEAGTAEAVAEVLVNQNPYENTEVRHLERDMVTYVGQPVRLRCMVSDRATIHWSREGLPLPPNARIKDDYLDLPRVRLEDSGRYICQTQTSHGVSSDYVNLNVSPTTIPAVSVEVSQDPVNIGDNIDIRCACSGTHNPRYYWSRPNHSSLPQNAQVHGNTLRLSNVTVSDSGLYRCTADTPDGTFEQDFNLVVHGGNNDAPAIETKLAPYGSSLEMDCRPSIDPPLTFSWSKLGGILQPDAQVFESKLKLTNVKAEDAGTYICTVNNDHENIEIPTMLVVTGVVPYFSQAPQSFIALPPLADSYLKFNIEISFKPQSYDGIILYNDESNRGNGDFIMLSLVRGYPQFSFDLGSGPTMIRAEKPVTLGEWHTIKLQRHRKEGTMLVDGEGPYKGIADGRKQGLDMKSLLFVGGVPSRTIITKYAEINSGFVGCISRLVIGEKEIDLIGDQTDSFGITNCETCAENPCNNGGVCQEAATKNGYICLCRADYSGKHCDYVGQPCYPGACGEGDCINKETGFECYCPYGTTGARCENTMKVYEPAFHDDKSYIAHDTPKALRRPRMNPTKRYDRLRARNAQVRNPRSRPHHHNKLHHTKH